MRLIGCVCKYSDVFSLAVLIGRGLDLEKPERSGAQILVFSFEGVFTLRMSYAPLAQLVEHLTLNQGVHGSSPWWCTICGPLVKRLRHRPLTAKTGVRFSYGSPQTFRIANKVLQTTASNVQFTVGVYDEEGPPVPIPNTVVKLFGAENTWRAAARENRSMLTSRNLTLFEWGSFFVPFWFCFLIAEFVIFSCSKIVYLRFTFCYIHIQNYPLWWIYRK